MTRVILERAGYTVLEACDGVQALAVADAYAGRIHALLTDVVMPHMSGPELARRLLLRRPEIGILCVSGYTDDITIEHALGGRRVAFLQKPASPSDLKSKLREVLDACQVDASKPSV